MGVIPDNIIILNFILFSAVVELQSVDHVQAGPTPDSFVYIEGQNISFVCNATPSIPALFWVVELTGQAATAAEILATTQPRIETGDPATLVNPSNITILNAMLGDSNTTVRCRDAMTANNIFDDVTIYVEGEHPYIVF